MNFCSKCGIQLQEGTQYCPSCGTAVVASSAQPNQHAAKQGSDAEMNKGMAIIAYILFFIPLLTGDYKKSEFVKYHTNQGTILFIATIALGVGINILQAILRAILFNVYAWALYGVFNTVLSTLWFVPTVLLILGVINAVNGKTKPLPIIGDKFTIIK